MRPVALALALLFVATCQYDSEPRPALARCDEENPCDEMLYCVFGQCLPMCETDRDCGPWPDRTCEETEEGMLVCQVMIGGPQIGCGYGPPCPEELVCDEDAGVCREPCAGDGDCPVGQSCYGDMCLDPTSTDGDADADQDADDAG